MNRKLFVVYKTVNVKGEKRKLLDGTMRNQMSALLTSKDFDDGQKIRSEKALERCRSACDGLKNRRRGLHKLAHLDEHLKLQKIGSEKTLKRWRSACNGRRSFHKLTGLDEHLKLQSNEGVPSREYIVTGAGTEARRFHEPIDDVGSTISGLDEQVRVSPVVLKAVPHFTENLSLRSNEDVPSSEYVVTEAATEARIFQEPVEDVGSTVSGLEELFRAASVAVNAVLHFTEGLGLPSNEDVTEARRFHEPISGVGSTVSGHDVTTFDMIVPQINFQLSNYASLTFGIGSHTKICELLGKYEKRALAVFYVVLEAAAFLLDIVGKNKRSILLAAFLLSASGFAITMSIPTCIVGRIRAAARMHIQNQKLLLVVLEISFSVVQLIVTFVYFLLAEFGVKHNSNAPVFPLVFAIIAAAFTFKYDGEVSDSSGLASRHISPAADNQVHMPNNTRNQDTEANGSIPMPVIVTYHDQ